MHLPSAGGWHIRDMSMLPLRPGDFALGSSLSRAAARAALERRFVARRRIDVVSSMPRPRSDEGIHIGPWIEGDDGVLFRFSNLPSAMTIQEAERVSAHVLRITSG